MVNAVRWQSYCLGACQISVRPIIQTSCPLRTVGGEPVFQKPLVAGSKSVPEKLHRRQLPGIQAWICLGRGRTRSLVDKTFPLRHPHEGAKLAHGGILPKTPRTHVFPQLTDAFEAILLRSRYFDPAFPDRLPALRNRRLDRPNRVLVLIVHDCPELALFFLARFGFGHLS